MKLKTFPLGGVHPAEHKLSAGTPILILPPTAQLIVPLAQNLGAPPKPIVKKGDEVKTGQLIARAEAFISANLHSPATGKVLKVDDALDATGYRRPAVFIEVGGEDQWADGIDTDSSLDTRLNFSKEEIVTKVKEAGIVGLGGATFPTHVKLMLPPGKTADHLLINGVECEPYLTSDHRLMLERAQEIMQGIRLMMIAVGVKKAIIGVENNKPDAIAHLSAMALSHPGISVQALKVKYPQGGEKQLIKALLNREVPSGKLPIEVGCVVSNVGTALAVYEAVTKNKPLIERVVTVTGLDIKKPSNLLVRVGTPITALIEAAGGLPEGTGKIINGGPMMGKALSSIEVPVVKGSSGILVMPKHLSMRRSPQPCIRCSKCTTVCPMGLEPFLLSKLAKLGKFEDAEKENIMDCIECGSCQYTCPSNLPLLDYLRVGKFRTGQMIRNRK